MTERADVIRTELEPVVEALGLQLFDVTLEGGTHAVLKVVVDRPGGVDLDAIEATTRRVSAALDAADPVRGAYTLEVSSPGVERTLRRPEHFAGAIGATVSVKVRDANGAVERLRGELTAVDDAGVTLQLELEARHVPFSEIEQARTVFEWGPAPKPGKGSKPGRAKKEAAV